MPQQKIYFVISQLLQPFKGKIPFLQINQTLKTIINDLKIVLIENNFYENILSENIF